VLKLVAITWSVYIVSLFAITGTDVKSSDPRRVELDEAYEEKMI
jgi:hypothetical protein